MIWITWSTVVLVSCLSASAVAHGVEEKPFNQHASNRSPFTCGAPLPPASSGKHSAYHGGSFTPINTLTALSDSHYTTLAHPAFLGHAVRIKKSLFCDGTVDAYTGYIDVSPARHLFFYFFLSRNDPDKDDAILWTNGGPGASSAMGLFMELGPCRITECGEAQKFEHSWNQRANVFFIDQPVGVGFSYAEYGESVGTTEEGAKDIAAFAAIFFAHFTQFQGRGFHMAGESYGGRYIPLYASAVYDQNTVLEQAGMAPINLSSIIIGNGIIDYETMIPSYVDMVCTHASLPPILDITTCVRMRQAVPRCAQWTKNFCFDSFDVINCGAATDFCRMHLMSPYVAAGRNPYDMSDPCSAEEYERSHCYPARAHIIDYLSRPDVQSALGVDDAKRGSFSLSTPTVNLAFRSNLDEYHHTRDYVAALLERGVKVLIYAGTYDWICNWMGNERWTRLLDWSGGAEFSGQALREWMVNDQVAGRTRSANGLTFATVEGAGHMVPYNKPGEALEMVNRWLSGESL